MQTLQNESQTLNPRAGSVYGPVVYLISRPLRLFCLVPANSVAHEFAAAR
jgi:hypothetical protein